MEWIIVCFVQKLQKSTAVSWAWVGLSGESDWDRVVSVGWFCLTVIFYWTCIEFETLEFLSNIERWGFHIRT